MVGKLRFVVGQGTPERVDRVLPRLLEGVSRATVQRWIEEGRVLVNGGVCRPRDPVGHGAVLDVDPSPPEPSAAEPDAGVELEVVHEDRALLVVNKPAGLVVHPARGHRTGTLVNGLLARVDFGAIEPDARDDAGTLRPGIVHRIDKDTSGLLVVAKTEASREALKAQLALHTVERVYVAFTLGVPRTTTIRTPYGRDRRSRLRFSSRVREGKLAVTHVAVREELAAGGAARVECRLETGRTHQIRVHLAEQQKTPLLADALYGKEPADPELARVSAALGRQALHAAVLGFTHPETGERLRFEAPLPDDMATALEALRRLPAR
ncbi:MAG TPA: RluA family pseudouridine synthase [Polyangiaceae bacterium]|nr:RluA family pseudouridine synthase [Polyangiaceae bacterium]